MCISERDPFASSWRDNICHVQSLADPSHGLILDVSLTETEASGGGITWTRFMQHERTGGTCRSRDDAYSASIPGVLKIEDAHDVSCWTV